MYRRTPAPARHVEVDEDLPVVAERPRQRVVEAMSAVAAVLAPVADEDAGFGWQDGLLRRNVCRTPYDATAPSTRVSVTRHPRGPVGARTAPTTSTGRRSTASFKKQNGNAGVTYTGTSKSDELLGHHGSDTLRGLGGSDVLWGDWDPQGPADDADATRSTAATAPTSSTARTARTGSTRGPGNDVISIHYGRGTLDCGPGPRHLPRRAHAQDGLQDPQLREGRLRSWAREVVRGRRDVVRAARRRVGAAGRRLRVGALGPVVGGGDRGRRQAGAGRGARAREVPVSRARAHHRVGAAASGWATR